ncbi:hypothetical protein K488DRAFT_73687, partial [Vararia minispora EC-137]
LALVHPQHTRHRALQHRHPSSIPHPTRPLRPPIPVQSPPALARRLSPAPILTGLDPHGRRTQAAVRLSLRRPLLVCLPEPGPPPLPQRRRRPSLDPPHEGSRHSNALNKPAGCGRALGRSAHGGALMCPNHTPSASLHPDTFPTSRRDVSPTCKLKDRPDILSSLNAHPSSRLYTITPHRPGDNLHCTRARFSGRLSTRRPPPRIYIRLEFKEDRSPRISIEADSARVPASAVADRDPAWRLPHRSDVRGEDVGQQGARCFVETNAARVPAFGAACFTLASRERAHVVRWGAGDVAQRGECCERSRGLARQDGVMGGRQVKCAWARSSRMEGREASLEAEPGASGGALGLGTDQNQGALGA